MPRPLLAVLLTALMILLGILVLIHWREIATFLLVAGTAWLIWQFKWLVLGVLGLSWLFGGEDGDF